MLLTTAERVVAVMARAESAGSARILLIARAGQIQSPTESEVAQVLAWLEAVAEPPERACRRDLWSPYTLKHCVEEWGCLPANNEVMGHHVPTAAVVFALLGTGYQFETRSEFSLHGPAAFRVRLKTGPPPEISRAEIAAADFARSEFALGLEWCREDRKWLPSYNKAIRAAIAFLNSNDPKYRSLSSTPLLLRAKLWLEKGRRNEE